MINFSTRLVGGIRFIKLGRFCFSFCICRSYTPLKQPHVRAGQNNSSRMLDAIERELACLDR